MKKLLVLFAVLALFAAACGGGDDDDSGSDDGGSDETASEDSGGGDTLSADEWCNFNDEVENLNLFGDDADFTSMEDSIGAFLEIVDEVEDIAPEEIKDDIAVMGEFMADFDEALSEVDYDFFSLTESQLAALDDPAVEEASENISQYAVDNCDVPAGDTDPSDEPQVEEPPEEDAGDDPVDELDPTSDDTLREVLVSSFMQSGMTEEQANCFLDKVDLEELASGTFDPLEFLDYYDQCGIDFTQLQ